MVHADTSDSTCMDTPMTSFLQLIKSLLLEELLAQEVRFKASYMLTTTDDLEIIITANKFRALGFPTQLYS